MDVKTAKYTIIEPTLREIGLYSEAALNLVAGVGSVESRYRTVHQVGGPALGYWQMEPVTEKDCWDNFLRYKPDLSKKIHAVQMARGSSYANLTQNQEYAAAMCRVKFYRATDPLPAPDDALALCRYWKKIYNTFKGAGQVDALHISLFKQAIEA